MQARQRSDDGASMIETLRDQIEQKAYAVDCAVVAAAMLARREESSRLRLLGSQVLVAAQGSGAATGEPEPYTGRYTA
jgi:hypothetical protein